MTTEFSASLDEASFAKAAHYVRALRRAILSYWYSTIEGKEAALIEAQHGYREAVQGRSVIETLFDADRFFLNLEPRLRPHQADALTYSFAEVPLPDGMGLYRPLEGSVGSVSLPDMATRWYERTEVLQTPADEYFEKLRRSLVKDTPASERAVTHRILDQGRCIGYTGISGNGVSRLTWVERSAQIGRDIKNGAVYTLEYDDGKTPVAATDNLKLSADVGSIDLLASLPEAEDALGLGRLRFSETYPDLYVEMRTFASP